MTDKENRLAQMVASQFAEITAATGGSGGGGGGGEGSQFLPDPSIYTYYKPEMPPPEFYRENFMDANSAQVMFPEGSSDLPAVGDKVCIIDAITPNDTSIPNEPYAVWGTVTGVNSTMFGTQVRINPEGSTVRVNAAHEKTVEMDSNVFGVTKVNVSGGSTPTGTKNITANGTYDVKNYASAKVNVPRTFTTSDNGKVVVNRALVSQTTQTVTANGTYDTTSKKTVTVNVPNSYSQSDEGKVVSSGALVSQTTQNITVNGTYDTTTKNEVVVNVSGGGGGVYEKWAQLHDNNTVNGSIDITDNDLPSGFTPSQYSFYYNGKLRSFSSQTITAIAASAFRYATSLETANFPNATTIASNAFDGCTALQTANFPNVTTVNNNGFDGCTALQSVTFDSLSTIGNQAFYNCKNMVSISGPFKSIKAGVFNGCSKLMSVHITQSDSVCTLSSGVFNGTPLVTDEVGYIYVPDALVDNYKSATNWSALASHIKGESEMDGGRDNIDIDDPEITEP
jgi:hypothetical protein